ncbi:MAG: hypothetical protein JOZ69_20735, partial [Myxococcales bacterium]|nr:hypothetical protein [Myxococcales bacterium]
MPLIARSTLRYGVLVSLIVPPAIAASCAKGAQVGNMFEDDSGTPGTSSGGPIIAGDSGFIAPPSGDGGGGGIVIPPATPDAGPGKCNKDKPCDDFQTAPILDPAAPPASDPSAMFGPATNGSATNGPCLVEPQDGALFPKNWLRPRILWTPGSKDQDLFEVRIQTPGEKNDLVIYTKNQFYVMDKALWQT